MQKFFHFKRQNNSFISDYLHCLEYHSPNIVSLESSNDVHSEIHVFPAVVVLIGVLHHGVGLVTLGVALGLVQPAREGVPAALAVVAWCEVLTGHSAFRRPILDKNLPK